MRITRDYQPQYSDPLEVASGEKVRVGREDEEFPGWRWCTAPDGREGWIPVELLTSQDAEASVLEEYSARELEVRSGEEVVVVDSRHEWLLVRNDRNRRGWIPASHAESCKFSRKIGH